MTEPTLLRTLIVDDDPAFRAYVKALARRLSLAVDEAWDGEEGLARLADTDYDLAIVDQEMPRVTGIELISRLRAMERNRHIYAIMLTGRDDVGTKIEALTTGFDDFMSKASTDLEITAKILAARRVVARQRSLDVAVRELYGLATRDELSGLYNRRYFMEEAHRALAVGQKVSFVLFDLDDFKRINDTFGHLTGDTILRDVGALFFRATRTEDLIARYGGDEFVMMIPHLPLPDVQRIANRLASDISTLRWSIGESNFGIGATCGVASSELVPGATLDQLLETADRDLYKNKWMRSNDAPHRPELYDYPPNDPEIVRLEERRDDDQQQPHMKSK